MRLLVLLLLIVVSTGCVNVAQSESVPHHYETVSVEDIFKEDISIRALSVNPTYIFYAGSNGSFGYLNTADHSVAYMGKIEEANEETEFRAIGSTANSDYILSAGNPALLYKVNYFGKRMKIYEEENEKVFYDAMAFWDVDNGIAIGDPTENCMSILLTKDGGQTWEKVPCDDLPPAVEGEAAFAASNTNIAIVGNTAWFVSGGKTSRIYKTTDMGETWKVYPTPMIDGKKSTGAYSLDFYDQNLGVMIGGDYTEPDNAQNNKAITRDGGKTWQLVANGKQPGYRSCIKFVPNTQGKEMVAVGFKGISYSSDYGETWKKLSEEPFYTLSFVNEFTAYAAGNNRISKITFIENMTSN